MSKNVAEAVNFVVNSKVGWNVVDTLDAVVGENAARAHVRREFGSLTESMRDCVNATHWGFP